MGNIPSARDNKDNSNTYIKVKDKQPSALNLLREPRDNCGDQLQKQTGRKDEWLIETNVSVPTAGESPSSWGELHCRNFNVIMIWQSAFRDLRSIVYTSLHSSSDN